MKIYEWWYDIAKIVRDIKIKKQTIKIKQKCKKL